MERRNTNKKKTKGEFIRNQKILKINEVLEGRVVYMRVRRILAYVFIKQRILETRME